MLTPCMSFVTVVLASTRVDIVWRFSLVNSGIWLPGYYKEFFETSHAKGPQDAAGGLLKNQADMAIIRGRVTIQNAFGLYKFTKDNLTIPKSHGCQRRIFKYIETIPRSVTRQYKPIPGIRSIHQVLVKKRRTLVSVSVML